MQRKCMIISPISIKCLKLILSLLAFCSCYPIICHGQRCVTKKTYAINGDSVSIYILQGGRDSIPVYGHKVVLDLPIHTTMQRTEYDDGTIISLSLGMRQQKDSMDDIVSMCISKTWNTIIDKDYKGKKILSETVDENEVRRKQTTIYEKDGRRLYAIDLRYKPSGINIAFGNVTEKELPTINRLIAGIVIIPTRQAEKR